MEIRTFDPRVSAAEAVDRTARLSIKRFLSTRIADVLGRRSSPEAVYPVYYPDYIGYTTVDLERLYRSNRSVKFLAGIDAVTSRVGEIDVDLPERRTETVDESALIPTDVDRDQARSEWREWIFPYIDRRFRPFKHPDFSLDELELIYVPYWLIDHGTLENSFVVSGLTKQVERVEDLRPVRDYYEAYFDRREDSSR